MADANHVAEIREDDRPIAVRRKRRNGSLLRGVLEINTQAAVTCRQTGVSTPPSTPKRAHKRVRFSDPGPAIDGKFSSSGLTPFMRRTSLNHVSSSKRRHSMPGALMNRVDDHAPFSGEVQFAPLRQVLEGRVKRRLKRHRLSEELNIIESEKRRELRARRSEIERLRNELAARDAEMQRMIDDQDIATQLGEESGSVISFEGDLTTKVSELEQEISTLRRKLEQQEKDDDATISDSNWAGPDADDFNDDHDDFTMTFEDFPSAADDEMIASTPDLFKGSFPSPPLTMPNTPCKSVSMSSAGVQVAVPDPKTEALNMQLKELQSQIRQLNAAAALNEDNQSRLADKLSEFISDKGNHDHSTLDDAIDTVLTQLALSQSQALENSARFSAIVSEITNLGFPSSLSDPEKIIATIAQQFRQARLDLEYLTPGEVVEGFENEKLLDMLLGRIKTLLKRVTEQDTTIDEYHEQEVSLRKQLSARVDAFDDVQKELEAVTSAATALREELREKEIGNERLSSALDGYRSEVSSLEKLIQTMEKESRRTAGLLQEEVKSVESKLQDEVLAHETTKAVNDGKDILIPELERRLAAALAAGESLKAEMEGLSCSTSDRIAAQQATIDDLKLKSSEQEKAHGAALALRDAQVSELKSEVERVGEALMTAQEVIQSLRRENKELKSQAEGEKLKGLEVVRAMRDQLSLVLQAGNGYLQENSTEISQHYANSDDESWNEAGYSGTVVRKGHFMDAKLARKSGGKRRRYDSGLGFLEEEAEEEEAEAEMQDVMTAL